MNTAALITLLTTGIANAGKLAAAYSEIIADLHGGAITDAEAEARIAAHHAAIAAARTAEDAEIAAKQ